MEPAKDSLLPLPEPYRWYWHPHMGWLDLLLGIVVYYLFPLKEVIPNEEDPDKLAEKSKQLRNKLATVGLTTTTKALKKWGACMGCDILQYNHVIPRRSSILLEWGIIDATAAPSSLPNSPIPIRIHIPESALKDIEYNRSDTSSLSCPVVTVDISQLQNNKDIPIILCLHGGGFHIGDSLDPALLELMVEVAKLTSEPFACAFCTYRQIPEHCFPAAIEDVLTVVLALMERFANIHIVGVSAGANLATVATMELHRRYPGRIRSATLLCPILNPAANSMSYYMNRNVWFPSPEWLRGCWRAYLGLPSSDTECVSDLDHGSNVTAWEASVWRNSPVARFVHPTIDLPDGLGDPDMTQFIVTTNEADPLCEDGKQLVERMQTRRAHVKHLSHSGSHWLGTAVDASGQMAGLVQEMARVVFPLRS